MTFFVDGRECSFEVSNAVEVLKPRPVTAVPHTPDFLLGILSVRGEMLPVIDLRSRLGAPEADDLPLARMLVVSVEDLKAGFIVDRMTGVEEIEKRAVRPPDKDKPEAGFPVEFIRGEIEQKGRHITLLNLKSLLEFTSSSDSTSKG
jgi:purine-binding chemotaxis protein CheW